MSKAMWNEFKENTKDFFLNPERNPDGTRMPGVNKQNVTAVLIAGFVGWLLITATVGARLKRTVKKLPIIGNIFFVKKKVGPNKYKTVRRRMPRGRRR